MKRSEYGVLFWIHLFIVILFVFLWLFFSWWIIIIGGILLRIQDIIIGGCFISKIEFRGNEGCIAHYLHKWHIVKNKKRARLFIGIFLPLIVIGMAIVWQIVLKIKPLII